MCGINGVLQSCQQELKRTTLIGKKMIGASLTNTKLKENYEELGKMVIKAIESGDLEWSNPRVKEIMDEVKSCKTNLSTFENDVREIKRN